MAGLLAEDCQVFYHNLHGSRPLGRVTDLLAARLKTPGLDELRIRTLLLISVLLALKNQLSQQKYEGDQTLPEPLTR